MEIAEQLEKAECECRKRLEKVQEIEKQLEKAKLAHERACSKLKKLKEAQQIQDSRNSIVSEETLDQLVNEKFVWSNKLKTVLNKTFRFENFRSKQLAVINATLSKKDVILVMPTGGGKSLVYQLPALVDEGFTVVVCPLISLMEDQLMAAKKFNIPAVALNSTIPKAEVKQIQEQMTQTNVPFKLIYVTPEWVAKNKRFMKALKTAYESNRIARVAIDEVHCCSTWGHDFRPDYLYLGLVRTMLPTVPFIGLTATATTSVLSDVQSVLSLEGCMIITAPFNRPNLFYKVVPKPPKKDSVIEYLKKLFNKDYAGQTGIIYTNTINDCINLAKELRDQGLRVAPYHAQLEPDQKKKIHNKWVEKTYQAVVATVAFGMGIDKPDVRFVIHHVMPRSMESLYQESGRAGRDDKYADCIILFSLADYFKLRGMCASLLDERRISEILEYCLEEKLCRRALIAAHFEEVWQANHCNKMCDNCKRGTEFVYYNISKVCFDIYNFIEKASTDGEKITLNKLLDAWFKTGQKKLQLSYLRKPDFTKQQAETILGHLFLQKYLTIEKGYTLYSTVCYVTKGKSVVDGKIKMLSADTLKGIPKIQGETHQDGSPPIKRERSD